MDTVELVGEEIWFGHYKIGQRPPGMCATQWGRLEQALLCPEPDEDVLSAEYNRGQDDAMALVEDEGSKKLARLKLALLRKQEVQA